MTQRLSNPTCALIGAPVQSGTLLGGCLMGPDALRTAGLIEMLESLGNKVNDIGNLKVAKQPNAEHPNPSIHDLAETREWISTIGAACHAAGTTADMTILMGGDHSVSAGSVPAFAKLAAERNQPFYVLWLDAHPDMHRLNTTESGNLHGTPVAYMMGLSGFDGHFPPLMHPIPPQNVCMMGLRSVDTAERSLIAELGIEAHDMRSIDEHGIKGPLSRFLERVVNDGGWLHVSLDVDFMDPSIACAVGTTVPGGATFREAHLIMELLHDSGLVRSLDLAELNPALDEQSKTARLLVDLTASLMGRTILDRRARLD